MIHLFTSVKKEYLDVLKNGTPGDDEERQPWDTTIPPTKGLKALKANRAFADKQLVQGHAEESITLYMIPWKEMNIMVAVDIEGFEWPQYTKPMSQDEIDSYVPVVKVGKKKKEKPEQIKDNHMKEILLPFIYALWD